MTRPLVGVIGGVGPLATAYFLDKVVRLTVAARDQDHLDMIVFDHAAIPDRTAHILDPSADDPGPVMADDARRLEAFGADFLVIPCNTAHNFTDEVEGAVAVPVVSIIEVTADEAQARVPGLRSAGLLATSGTASSGVYQRALAARGVECLRPDDGDQAMVMEIIYDQIKAGRPADVGALRDVVHRLMDRGAQVIVLGCTELSVVAEDQDLLEDPRYVDSLDVLARRAIERAGGTVRD